MVTAIFLISDAVNANNRFCEIKEGLFSEDKSHLFHSCGQISRSQMKQADNGYKSMN